jgi:hypothetical protein
MSAVHRNVALAVHEAAEETRAILTVLEKAGHPPTGQTGQTAFLLLALTSLEKRLLEVEQPSPPSIDVVVLELELLARECAGRLAPIEPLIEKALRIARQG